MNIDEHKKAGPGPCLMGAHTLIGDNVYNIEGEKLGRIEEIMLNVHESKISYAVLSFGGFLGLGDKLFAVPWRALTLDTLNKQFVLNIEKDILKNAPGFDKNDWPDMANQKWASGIDCYYSRDF